MIKNITTFLINKMQSSMQQATNKITNIDPIEFFNEGKIVYIDLVFNNIKIQALFKGFPDGTVKIIGNFPRANSISAKLPLEEFGYQVCYDQACIQMLPQGIAMVMKDYPIAKEKHKKDQETGENSQ